MFAYGALGKEAVLVASLSNSVLLVMHVVGGEGQAEGGSGLRSWLLEWPVAGKVGSMVLEKLRERATGLVEWWCYVWSTGIWSSLHVFLRNSSFKCRGFRLRRQARWARGNAIVHV